MTRRAARSAPAMVGAMLVVGAATAGCSSDGGGDIDAATTTEVAVDTSIGVATVSVPAVTVHLDLQPTGNRVISGVAALIGPPDLDVSIAPDPSWVFGLGGDGDDRRWVVVDAAGVARLVGPDGDGVVIDQIGSRVPITVEVDRAGRLDLRTVADRTRHDGEPFEFADPLPDTRVVLGDDAAVALGGPTDRYRHGVLGDLIEASTVELIGLSEGADTAGATTILEIGAPDVTEAVSPMLADVDADGRLDVLLTVANGEVGARLAAYDMSGALLVESDPIGRGNRWRNQLAVAPVGPNGEIEVVEVSTPHIGGIAKFHRIDPSTRRLEQVAATAEYSTHAIGSRNLDLGIVVDADGDGQLDVVVPTQDRSTLVAIERTAEDPGVDTSMRVDLGARMTSNLAATPRPDGTVDLAVTTADGRLLAWYGS